MKEGLQHQILAKGDHLEDAPKLAFAVLRHRMLI
jgi:hypothetical protein